MPPGSIRARLFGHVYLRVGDRLLEPTDFPRRSSRSLFLLLLATPGHARTRDQVCDLLWPSATPEFARNALDVSLHALRRVLEPSLTNHGSSLFIGSGSGIIRIRPDVDCSVDVDDFELSLKRVIELPEGERRTRLRHAVSIYANDLLSEEPSLDWPVLRREALRRVWEESVLTLANLDAAAGDPLASVPHLEALLVGNETLEEAHRALIIAFGASRLGERARRQYDLCVKVLNDQLGVEPSLATRQAFQVTLRIETIEGPTLPIRTAPFNAPPVQTSPLIGRDSEIGKAQDALLGPHTRLVTLTGLGGIGKTHLALAIIAAIQSEFSDGVLYVALSSVRDAGHVLSAIAQAAGIRDDVSAARTSDRLSEAFRDREILLVLDNFEHVIAAAPIVAEILSRSAGMKALVTSRERLRLRGEFEIEVPPLQTPDPARVPTPMAATRIESIALLVDRLRLAIPEFTLTQENVTTIATICHRLDGIPLAIELASSWSKHITLPSLASRLQNPLDLPAGGLRDLPDRHQTMRAALAWSYALLTEESQSIFRRLAVFSGGIPSEAIEIVLQSSWGDSGRPLHDGELRRGLAELRDQGLISRSPAGIGERFTMLETIRTFAWELLDAAGEAKLASEGHALWIIQLAEGAAPALETHDQDIWVDRLELELDNLRAALTWCLTNRANLALQIASDVCRFWELRGLLHEGQDWLERAMAARTEDLDALSIRAHYGAGTLAILRGDFAGAGEHLTLARSTAEADGDQKYVGRTTVSLGSLAFYMGDYESADALLSYRAALSEGEADQWGNASALIDLAVNAFLLGEKSISEHRARDAIFAAKMTGDPNLMTRVLTISGQLAAWNADYQTAVSRITQALDIATRRGDRDGIARAHLRLGEALGYAGDIVSAKRHLDISLVLSRELGRIFQTATVLLYRASLAMPLESKDALLDLQECLQVWHRLGSRYVLDVMQAMSGHLVNRGAAAPAAELLSAVSAIRSELHMPLRVERYRIDFDAQIDAARSMLASYAFELAWTKGARLSLDEAVQRAFDVSSNV